MSNAITNSTTNIYTFGTAITFKTKQAFTSVDGVIIDPDRVLFGFIIDGNASQTYTFTYNFGTGDTTGTIVRTGTGLYQATIDTSAYTSGVWIYSFACEPVTAIGHDSTKTKVRVEDSVIVQSASFAMG